MNLGTAGEHEKKPLSVDRKPGGGGRGSSTPERLHEQTSLLRRAPVSRSLPLQLILPQENLMFLVAGCWTCPAVSGASQPWRVPGDTEASFTSP